jgi:hypothetical protein
MFLSIEYSKEIWDSCWKYSFFVSGLISYLEMFRGVPHVVMVAKC